VRPLTPLEALVPARRGRTVPLPPELARLYGSLRIPRHLGRPHVIANVVTSLDGVVSLRVAGHASGGDISGHSRHDRLVMGLLRAIADVIVVGAETLRVDRRTIWTAGEIFPDLADEFRRLRQLRGQSEPPLNVVVSASGRLDLGWRVFASGEVPALIATTAAGARRLQRHRVPRSTAIRALGRGRAIRAGAILAALGQGPGVVLIEGGPRLLGDFVAERVLDEQFLTLAPQLAGREDGDGRPGLIAGRTFAPRDPRWGRLVDLRRGGSHLFLRYGFPVGRPPDRRRR
jgi:riboflavin biosynthesis pyrimidine reductase